jgi:starch phosphorylase
MEVSKSIRTHLESLSRNLWWTWQPEIAAIFRDLGPTLWNEVNHNPIAFLKRMSDETLMEHCASYALADRVLGATRRLARYLKDADTWCANYAGVLNSFPVAYFSAEFGIHESLPLYSGGLGVLAGDHLKSASDLGVPLVGVGLFYAHGYFSQHLDQAGWQQEEYGQNHADELPLELARDASGERVLVQVPCGKQSVHAQIWQARIGRCQILLLDTDIDLNPEAFRPITHRLYWGDQTTRILQEMVLGIGGMRALRKLGIRPGVLHLNEGHSSFALLEAIYQEMETNGCTFDEATHTVGSKSVFTTHTPVPAGHDRFGRDLMESKLAWMAVSLGISMNQLMGLGRVKVDDPSETFCMTVLALKLAHRANGVASVHGDVSRQMWKALWPDRRTHEVPIGHVTNGVHSRSWMAPQFMTALERHLGTNWSRRTSRQELWRDVNLWSPLEIWEIHQILKAELIAFARARAVKQDLRRGMARAAAETQAQGLLKQDVLTLGFARRFATYKRATLMFEDQDRLARILNDPQRPVQLVFAGKSHPKDDGGKRLIQSISQLAKSPEFAGKIAFLEDYDINVARHLVHGVDVWVNNPMRPEEACGTSGMKAVLNGILNLSIRDGWWAEAFDGRNGFDIPSEGPHKDAKIQDVRDHEALLAMLESEVVPLYYTRDEDGLPLGWIERMKWAFATLAWRFSADRMVKDYVMHSYLPAARGDSCSSR